MFLVLMAQKGRGRLFMFATGDAFLHEVIHRWHVVLYLLVEG